MDSGHGKFNMFDNEEKLLTWQEQLKKEGKPYRSVFRLGEVVELKESQFKIVKITARKLTLRLLPK